MKKTAAILLLGIFVFNLFGYRLYVSYLVNNVNQSLEISLDNNNYDEEELISIKSPISLPYYNNNSNFSRAYGEVEVNGIIYQYVKSRIFNDSLELLCIPNISKQQLLTAKNNFSHIIFDVQNKSGAKNSGKEKQGSLVKLISEYEKTVGWVVILSSIELSYKYNITNCNNRGVLFKATIEQPPDLLNG